MLLSLLLVRDGVAWAGPASLGPGLRLNLVTNIRRQRHHSLYHCPLDTALLLPPAGKCFARRRPKNRMRYIISLGHLSLSWLRKRRGDCDLQKKESLLPWLPVSQQDCERPFRQLRRRWLFVWVCAQSRFSPLAFHQAAGGTGTGTGAAGRKGMTHAPHRGKSPHSPAPPPGLSVPSSLSVTASPSLHGKEGAWPVAPGQ